MDRHPLGRATAHGAHFVKWPLAALLALTLAACGGSDNGNPPALNVDASGASSFNAGQLASNLGTYALESLSAAGITSLQFMREEEQLAHDVYAASALLWPQPIFSNIAASESTHAAAVQTLLDRYQLDDPRTGLADGQYRDAALQALHDQFVQRSRLSLVEALRVGAEIEELDIADLRQQPVDNADILMVYDHLERGSRNHLRAFVSALKNLGVTYVPTYLAAAEFDAIVNSDIETGR